METLNRFANPGPLAREGYFVVSKDTWGDGPWQNEPDHVNFTTAAGLPAICHRNTSGSWCGYVAVPPGHPAHGKGCDDVDVSVHGGLTYADVCQGDICHVPEPGEPDDVFWFGFDCCHCMDVSPAHDALFRKLRLGESLRGLDRMTTYRDLAYVRAECESLAEQLAAMS